MIDKLHGKYFSLVGTNEKPLIKRKENGVCMTPRELIPYLNKLYEQYVEDQINIDFLVAENQDFVNKWELSQQKIIPLEEEIQWRKQYQRTLENKIRRLKDRIKVLEGNYGEGDKERLQKAGKAKKDKVRRVKW